MIRFEIVTSNATKPFHGRCRAGNSLTWWTTQQYTRKANARKAAVNLIVGLVDPDTYDVLDDGVILVVNGQNRMIGIVEVDER